MRSPITHLAGSEFQFPECPSDGYVCWGPSITGGHHGGKEAVSIKERFVRRPGIGNIKTCSAEDVQPPGNLDLGWAINYVHKRDRGHPLNTRLSWQERRISSGAASDPSLLLLIIISPHLAMLKRSGCHRNINICSGILNCFGPPEIGATYHEQGRRLKIVARFAKPGGGDGWRAA